MTRLADASASAAPAFGILVGTLGVTMATDEIVPAPDSAAFLARLAILSRNHLLYFRIEVGRAVFEDFFHRDREAYHRQDPRKVASLRRFSADRVEELADLGLSEKSLRQCLLAWFVVQDLPREVVRQLVFSHVVELSRVEDGSIRRELAQAAIDNAWNGKRLRDAVLAARAGRWLEAGAASSDSEPASSRARTQDRRPQPGRVVSRFERTAADLDDLVGQWEQVPVEELTDIQAARVKDAVALLEDRIAKLASRLAP